MTLQVGLTMTGNASGAASAVRSVKDEIAQLKGGAAQLTAELAETRAALTTMAAAGEKTGANVDALREKQTRLNVLLAQNRAQYTALQAGTTAVGAASGAAAAQAGVLAAQFNDVFTVLASGQNPLQAGIQQGMQIGQVFQQSGFQVSLLKQALVGMSAAAIPIAVITGVGLLTQALMNAGEEAVNAAEAIDALEERVDEFTASAEQAARPAADLIEKFGTMAFRAEALFDIMARTDRLQALNEMSEAAAALMVRFDGLTAGVAEFDERRRNIELAKGAGLDFLGPQGVLEDRLAAFQEQFGLTEAAARGLVDEVEAFNAAVLTGSPAEIAAAGQALAAALDEAANSGGRVPPALLESLQLTGQLTLSSLQYAATDMTKPGDDAIPVMTRLGLILTEVFATAQAVGNVSGSGMLSGALANAGALYQRLNAVAELARANAAAVAPGAALRGLDDERGSQREGRRDAAAYRTRLQLEALGLNPDGSRRASAGGGGGGGGGAARAEADAVQELITKLQAEVATAKELDPLKRELLSHREALAGATEAERAQVTALIAEREREEAAAAGLAARVDLMNSLTGDVLNGLIVQGETVGEVFRNVAASIAQAAIQAAIFGKGPFGSLFGGTGLWDGLLGGLGGGGVLQVATGGLITGAGTDTSDNIPAWLSPGEFVVNAASTRRHRALLEQINSAPRFASGGAVGGGGGGGGVAAVPAGDMHVVVDVRGARGDREIEEAARRGTAAALQEYDRSVLPRSMQRISRDQRRVG